VDERILAALVDGAQLAVGRACEIADVDRIDGTIDTISANEKRGW
jgi:hypothetical protein